MVVERVAVNCVDAKQHGYAQPRAKRDLLQLPRVVPQHVQKRARAEPRPAQRFLARYIGKGNLHHLRGLFLQRHLRKQGFHAHFEFGVLRTIHRHSLFQQNNCCFD
ncbi:hypothetical protein SDC9_195237 [bioreactor metagenome]|uniref:Uncharacterized protein n=1 Tax=bioreactor metagenome TaxID=1076179 RepID=A0A645IH51_9ZZZZ